MSGVLKKPEFILFDYGNTIMWEPGFDYGRGERALFSHVVQGESTVTFEEFSRVHDEIFALTAKARDMDFEISESQMLKLKLDRLGLTLDVSLEEAEELLWDTCSEGECMPGLDRLLKCLYEQGIRTAVVSNMGWSGENLTHRIDRLLPGNHFEFVLTSSDVGIRKPQPMIFEAALAMSGAAAQDVWFCGDNIRADLDGAHSAGIFPVMYESRDVPNPWSGNEGLTIDYDHLKITHWDEMTELISSL